MQLVEIESTLRKWETFGRARYNDGSVTIGKDVDLSSQRWMHILFAPAQDQLVRKLASDFPFVTGFPYFGHFKDCNGLDLFFGDFVLYGVRVAFKKGNVPYIVFDIFDHNRDFREYGLAQDKLIIGSINDGKERHLVQDRSGLVFSVERSDGALVSQWPSLEALIREEIARLESVYADAALRDCR